MNSINRINEDGKLVEGSIIDNSKFFDILVLNDKKEIEDWLISNGHIKPYCPIRFINNDYTH